MSENKMATKEDLKEFYNRIYPYLGGSAAAGFTPVGTVISVMSNHAPANYLVCDGTVYNIADYPELANHFLNEFGSKNNFGGDGTTTFAVPDLRGEFLRGTGTNSHTNQGSGANVGVHQDGTIHQQMDYTDTGIQFDSSSVNNRNFDSQYSRNNAWWYETTGYSASGNNGYFTSRPTNTAVLYCIATKNIYLNQSLDYSTDEKVVGTWIDGKPIYQKTISCGQVPQAVTSGTRVNKEVAHGITNIDRVISLIGSCYKTSSLHACEPIMPVQLAMNNTNTPGLNVRIDATNIILVNSNTAYNGMLNIYATIQYTKTTDA